MRSVKLSYLPGIVIALVGVVVQAFEFDGFDHSKKHQPEAYAASDVRADENRVNEMAVIAHRLEGASITKRDPMAVGMEAFGALSAVATGGNISEGVEAVKGVTPEDFIKSSAEDPRIKKFHTEIAVALSEANDKSNSDQPLITNQVDLLNR